ncbi:MAG TPA: hypothetical protein VGG64_01770 [Pirellulales bacterium]
MSPTICDPDDHDVQTVRRQPMSRRFRQVGPTGPYRAKDGAEPVLPLPRWTFWALLGWSVGMATIYTAILAGWWE